MGKPEGSKTKRVPPHRLRQGVFVHMVVRFLIHVPVARKGGQWDFWWPEIWSKEKVGTFNRNQRKSWENICFATKTTQNQMKI